MKTISNPILKGFNPDPSIIRVDDDYYISTSTFEWFPGVQIHHSKDLVNWTLLTHPLTKTSQLDMKGVPDSCGVWAPCLTHTDGVFYLVYTNVKNFNGDWKDTPNFVITATDICGPWSDPTLINSSGFDPSLFHDDDGKSYFVNMLVDHRNSLFFGGIVLQEYDRNTNKVIGKVHHIFSGSEHGLTEGPHIYKKNGYYYLLTAEGGTSYDHCVSLARSTSLLGPYEIHPSNPVLTSKLAPSNYLQKTGHADLVETQNGEWYMVFLTGRPLTELGRCITGRETAIEKVTWHKDDWLYLDNSDLDISDLDNNELDQNSGAIDVAKNIARRLVKAPNLPEHKFAHTNSQINFDSDDIDINLQSLRIPITNDWANQTDRQGFLRLYGRESRSSCFEQSLLARRIQAHHTVTSTCLEFSPENFQQMAGLVCYYNTTHYYYLYLSGDDIGFYSGKKFINVLSCDDNKTTYVLKAPIDVSAFDKIHLKADFNGASLQFFYTTNIEVETPQWEKIGPELDGSILSDDYVVHIEKGYSPNFTGAFVGLACQDLSGQKIHADFEFFAYEEIT
jgi:xylan 1,4-beta-xylosidase